MSDRFSLLAVVAASVAVGVVFCYVLWPFLLPLFFAAVLSLIFRPMFLRLVGVCRGYRRCAAAISALSILLLVLTPLTIFLILAGRELLNFGQEAVQSAEEGQLVDPREYPQLADWIEGLRKRMPADAVTNISQVASRGLETFATEIYQRSRSVLANAFQFVVGLAVMVLAIYYFLADGPDMLRTARRLSPLEDADMQELFERFDQVCRSVILGTFVAAFVQSVLAGLGFFVAGVEGAFFLALLTLFVAMIPFLGSAAVWIPVAIALLCKAVTRPPSAWRSGAAPSSPQPTIWFGRTSFTNVRNSTHYSCWSACSAHCVSLGFGASFWGPSSWHCFMPC